MAGNVVQISAAMREDEALTDMLQMSDQEFIDDTKQEILRTIKLGIDTGDYERTRKIVSELLDIIV